VPLSNETHLVPPKANMRNRTVPTYSPIMATTSCACQRCPLGMTCIRWQMRLCAFGVTMSSEVEMWWGGEVERASGRSIA
jgi:hypothetical protein